MNRRGASALEFALLLPVFLVLVGGMVDYAWYMQQRALVVRAVREGVRVGAVTPLASDPAGTATARAVQVLTDLTFDAATSNVTASYDDLRVGLTCNTIDTVTVQAIVPFIRLIGIVPTPPAITVQMTMMLEDGDCA